LFRSLNTSFLTIFIQNSGYETTVVNATHAAWNPALHEVPESHGYEILPTPVKTLLSLGIRLNMRLILLSELNTLMH
ncbi:MAG: hypothetical protein AB8V19_02780, partial [Candidatus Midichloria sp.]